MTDWDHLKRTSKMQTQEDISYFENKIWDLVQTKDPIVLQNLMDLFDDNCTYPEVMYSLVHAIENYSNEMYVKGVISNTDNALMSYPNWFLRLIYGILNHKDCYKIFLKNMNLTSKESLLKLFDSIDLESLMHHEKILELREELKRL